VSVKLYITKKLLLLTLCLMVLGGSIGFTYYHVNEKFESYDEKIVQMQHEIRRTEHRVEILEEENTKLKKATEEFYELVTAEDSSRAEEIADSLGNILRGFIF